VRISGRESVCDAWPTVTFPAAGHHRKSNALTITPPGQMYVEHRKKWKLYTLSVRNYLFNRGFISIFPRFLKIYSQNLASSFFAKKSLISFREPDLLATHSARKIYTVVTCERTRPK